MPDKHGRYPIVPQCYVMYALLVTFNGKTGATQAYTNHCAVKVYKMLICRGLLELKNKGLIFLQLVVEMLA